MIRHKLQGPPPTVRPWARRARVVNPTRGKRPEILRIEQALPTIQARLQSYYPHAVLPPLDASRSTLTRLQRILRTTTEQSRQVANDPVLQNFRKDLHAVLDH